MKIKYKDEEIEAFNLIMKKEWARKILDGSKTVEFRDYSDFYIKRFTIEENFYENNRRIEEAEKNGTEPVMLDEISPIRAIHFRPYTKSWHLDCLIDGIKLIGCDAGGAKEIRDDWGSHDLDDFNDIPEGEGPLTFALHISEIVSHQGI